MNRTAGLAVLAFLLLLTLIAIDQIKNDEPFLLANFILDVLEKAVLVAAVVATAYIAMETRTLRRERGELAEDLDRARTENDSWRNAARIHLEGLSKAIEQQFAEWRLTDSETDIAFLMLKGLSLKEIASLRGSEQTTVRQQATSVYRKSGLANRAELGAYFLEDLLPARPQSLQPAHPAPSQRQIHRA
jgi:DNA-binding NarL/FixJ family response regulator